MPYTADPYNDALPNGATLAMNLDEEVRAVKGALIDHKARIIAVETNEATTLAVGRVRLATNAEFLARTDATHPITAAQLAMVLEAIADTAQYKVVLGGELSLRFGTTVLRNTGVADTPVVFDVPFTGSIKGILLTRKATASGQEGTDLLYREETVNGFTITHAGLYTAFTISWAAFGVEV